MKRLSGHGHALFDDSTGQSGCTIFRHILYCFGRINQVGNSEEIHMATRCLCLPETVENTLSLHILD